MNLGNAELTFSKISNKKLLDRATSLTHSGTLEQQSYYSFLKIEDDFIHELYPLLESDKTIMKPDYFSSNDSIGAHITVAYEEEQVILAQSDIGHTHYFKIEELCSTILGNKEYFVLLVKSPSLTTIRTKQQLFSRPIYKNVLIEFHITIGVRLL